MRILIHKQKNGARDLDVVPSVRSGLKPGKLLQVTRDGLAGTVKTLLDELKRKREAAVQVPPEG